MSIEQIILIVGIIAYSITNHYSRLFGSIIGIALTTYLSIWAITGSIHVGAMHSSSDNLLLIVVFLICVFLYVVNIVMLVKAIKAPRKTDVDKLLSQGDELLKTGQRAQAFAIYTDGLRLELKANRPESIKEFKSFERIRDLYTGIDMDPKQASDLARELSRLHCAMHNKNGKMQVQQELDTYIKALPSIGC